MKKRMNDEIPTSESVSEILKGTPSLIEGNKLPWNIGNYIGRINGSDKSKSNTISKEVADNFYTKDGKQFLIKGTRIWAFQATKTYIQANTGGYTIIPAMVETAIAHGWNEIKAHGNHSFQRAVWLEGKLRGLNVAGYTPEKKDWSKLLKRFSDKQRNNQNQGQDKDKMEGKTIIKAPDLVNKIAVVEVAKKLSKGMQEPNKSQFTDKVREQVATYAEKGQKAPDINIKEEQRREKEIER